jgi:hypothetical protein
MSENPPRELTGHPSTVAQTDAPAKRHRAGPGRRTELTPRIQEIICATIAAGNYQNRAAAAAGISESTLIKWRKRGRRGEELYAALNAAIDAAERDCEVALVAKVKAAADDDWRAAAFMLERKHPENWSREREKAAFGHSYEAGGAAGFNLQFAININLGPTFDKDWEEEVRRRRMAAIPAVSDDDARRIEIETPSSKI